MRERWGVRSGLGCGFDATAADTAAIGRPAVTTGSRCGTPGPGRIRTAAPASECWPGGADASSGDLNSLCEPGTLARAWGYNTAMSEATSAGSVTVGVRDLKNQLSRYLNRVKEGEEITVTEHGRPIARLTSVTPEVDRRAALIAAGIVRPAPASRRQLPSQRVRIAPGDPLGELVAQQRR